MSKPRIPRLPAGAAPAAAGAPPIPRAVLARNAALELALTAALLFTIVSAVRWIVGEPSIAGVLGSVRAQVAAVAAVAGLAVLAIILSPGGRRSGAHVNPAVTVALWRMRAFPARAVAPYVAAQLAGSVLGVGLARVVWGDAAAAAPVRDGAVAPAAGWHGWDVWLTEAGCLVVVTLIIGFVLAHPADRFRRVLPYVLAATTFAMAAGLGTLSGASVNPARQLGPAVWSGDGAFLAAYLLAPLAGALLGAAVHLRLVRRPVGTYKLSGEPAHPAG